MTADYDPLTLPAAYFEGLPTGVPNNLPSQPEPVEVPSHDDYREACWQHSDSHYEAATNPEFCEDDHCPHWPSWWTSKS